MPTSITLPNTLVNGATADATEVMADLNAIVTRWNADVASATGDVVGTTAAQTITNKTLTTPIIPSIYQDTGKTKLLTVPNTASDTLAAIAATQTLTNKRITKRVVSEADSATPTPNADTTDEYVLTALAQAAAFAAPSGTPTQGQTLIIRIKDNGTARALTWNAIYRAIGVTLPTTTVISKTLYVGCIYNSTDTKWDVIATSQEA